MAQYGGRRRVLVGLAGVTLLAGCATWLPERHISKSRGEIAAVNRAFEAAARRGDLEGLAGLYSPDAIAFPPDGPMVRGRDNIKQMWEAVVTATGLKSVQLQTVDLEIAGNTAYESGEATLRLEPQGGAAATGVVKYVVVWKKVDGQWRLHRDIWNSKAAE